MPAGDFKTKFAAPRHAVTLYEVQFDSVIPEWDNQPTLGSGLLAIAMLVAARSVSARGRPKRSLPKRRTTSRGNASTA